MQRGCPRISINMQASAKLVVYPSNCKSLTLDLPCRGQAQNGELGYGPTGKKSSANPDKVHALEGVHTHQVACGIGHTLFLVKPGSKQVSPTLHCTTLLQSTTTIHYSTTIHYTMLHCTTLHCTALPCAHAAKIVTQQLLCACAL